jgi:hypothetical protein
VTKYQTGLCANRFTYSARILRLGFCVARSARQTGHIPGGPVADTIETFIEAELS